jgi:uncharacterized protein (DUF1778 family)
MVGGMTEENVEGVDVADAKAHADDFLPGRRRGRDGTRRLLRLTPRLSVQERAEVDAAAEALGMSVNGFAAEAVLAVARRLPMSYGAALDREALARLQRELFAARTAVNRFGSNVNQAVAALHATGDPPLDVLAAAAALCARVVQHLDEVVAEVHRQLR